MMAENEERRIMGRGEKHAFWTLIAFLCGLTTLGAMDVDKVPNPRERDGGWVEDAGGVLGPSYVALINGICRTLNEATTAELAVITVDDLAGMTVEDYTERLFRRFRLGAKGKDNGILLLFSRDDRKVRLEVGYGLEGAIPDGLASRILDEHALPDFREGRFGRGLFRAAREVARTAAVESGAGLDIGEPAAWPEQVVLPSPPEPRAAAARRGSALKARPWNAGLLFGAGLFLYMLVGSGLVGLRVAARKSKTAKTKSLGGGSFFLVTVWIAGFVGAIVLANLAEKLLPFFLAYIAGGAAGSAALMGFRKNLKRKIAAFRADCPSCRRPMRLLDETADDAFLTAEEIAEESAGGMNYEIWSCDACGATREFAVKLGKAGKCPRCKRRTLVSSTTTIVAATKTQGGRVRVEQRCANSACAHRNVRERSTARLSSPSSRSSSGSSGRSGSSFGGGRSGGGGASKGW
jgi:uncharacterized protein